ncbi:MAG: RHS repeat-associated core domain-containing protein [Verrucomicrobia bacterium]|nr:RHS repeat-associated core domain-containing protein [Verrucomicrobiota bacterium]
MDTHPRLSMPEVSTDQQQSWQTVYRVVGTPVTTHEATVLDRPNRKRTLTRTTPDGTKTVTVYQDGRLQSVTHLDASTPGAQLGQTLYGYDAFGRQNTVTDARNGTTGYTYNAADQIASTTTPAPSPGEPAQLTTTYYDTLGQVSAIQYPDGTTVGNLYHPGGLLQITWGSRTYPVEYAYDTQRRMRQMKTWQDYREDTGWALTQWNYDNRGLLKSKDYPHPGSGQVLAGSGPVYTYTPGSRLWTRTWDRAVQTTYTYNAAGDLETEAYGNDPSSMLGVKYIYDRRGRLDKAERHPYGVSGPAMNDGTRIDYSSFTYNDANQPLTEAHSGGTLNGLSMSQYNQANQRTRATLQDGSYWVYQYDRLGQVISGCRFWQDGTPVAGQQFEYRFDDIGNRDTTGGRASAVSDYTANPLNQYWSRTVAPYVDVTGIANPTADVKVNGNTANRKGEYFHWPLNVPNGSPQYPTVEVSSQYGAGQTERGDIFVPASSEVFLHDTDGNLTQDGRWTYTWDGENRLVKMVKRFLGTDTAKVWDPVAQQMRLFEKLTFEYDHRGRRIAKRYFETASIATPIVTCLFLYDGWNLICELDAGKNRLRTYVWGTDLSGTLSGAGGVGGLLWVNNYQTTYAGKSQPTGVHFVAYDGNGNVAALVNAASGITQARYEYGPFAEPIRTTGDLADANPFRFSTKWTENESGLLYYGYRYDNPTTGRWLNRDPIEELGGLNNYLLARNSPIGTCDILEGLWFAQPTARH